MGRRWRSGSPLDVVYSRLAGWIGAADAERVLGLLERIGFELYANELHYADSNQEPVVLKGLEEFREHLGGELTVTLLQGIGRGAEVHVIESGRVLEAMEELRVRHQVRGDRGAAVGLGRA
jgi:3-dehydroquinate synthase